MKKMLFSIVATLVAILLSSCSKESLNVDDPDNNNSTDPRENHITVTANPAITYMSAVEIGRGNNKNYYHTIAVMDTNGTNQTNIFTGRYTTTALRQPTWSPDGNSISWIKQDYPWDGPSEILVADISVNSNGVPVAQNVRTIATLSGGAPDNLWMYKQSWCSVSSTAKIAFLVVGGTSTYEYSYIYTVSTSGGDWEELAAIEGPAANPQYGDLCWSPDDSKIAVTLGTKIMIFDMATKTFTDSISVPSGMNGFGGVEWSRSGLNSIITIAGTSRTKWFYYLTPPENGTIPTTNYVNGDEPTWSPDNSSIMFKDGNSLKKMCSFSSSVTTIFKTFRGNQLNWKR